MGNEAPETIVEFHPEWQFGGVRDSFGQRRNNMAIRDAGDPLFSMSLKDAVDLARKEGHSDRDIAVLLKVDEDRVKAIPRIEPIIKLEDLQFRPDTSGGGGKVMEYPLDGQVKTQVVPKAVGDVLEASVKKTLSLEIRIRTLEDMYERLASTSGRGDGTGVTIRGRAAGKEKAKANTKARARKGS